MLKPNFQRIHNGLEQLGVDTQPIYKELGISMQGFAGGRAGVTMRQYLEFLKLASERSGRPFLGALLGQSSDPDELEIMSYLVRNAPTFKGWTELLSRYLYLVSPGAEASVIVDGDTAVLTYGFPSFSADLSRQDVEGTIVQYTETLRELVKDKSWRPTHVYFQHSLPERAELLEDMLTENITSRHHVNGVAFPTEFLERPISNADPRLLKILEEQVRVSANNLDHQGDLVRELTLLISSGLGETNLSIQRIAPHVGMSRRTLHRRLADQGTSFSEIRDSVMAQVSKEILSTTNASITEISQQLGYSDASAFNRAFKRLTGQAPSSYRRLHKRSMT